MKKSLIFLTALFVCALMRISAPAQPMNLETPARLETLAASETSSPVSISTSVSALSISELSGKMAEAKQLLRLRSVKATPAPGATVSLAVFDPETSEIHLLSVSKDTFLIKDAELSATTDQGQNVRVRVVRANGVNTAVIVTDSATGRSLLPLVVEYPITKGDTVTETAYYTSAHPALLSSDVVSAGESYVTTMLDGAATSLAEKGVSISPDIVDIAEHLCLVEHTDHKRFLNEDHAALFPEILSLYALNRTNTYRYSVSSAGAGGMIQMIPRTYEGIRQNHESIGLNPDFVAGMRDHANALEAMLLYMQDTWKGLEQSSDVQSALRSGIATKPELLAAGYNSNPMRLPAYLSRGGSQWRTLIPAETQMYLAIYSAVDSNVKFDAPAVDEAAASLSTLAELEPGIANRSGTTSVLMSWLSKELLAGSAALSRLLP